MTENQKNGGFDAAELLRTSLEGFATVEELGRQLATSVAQRYLSDDTTNRSLTTSAIGGAVTGSSTQELISWIDALADTAREGVISSAQVLATVRPSVDQAHLAMETVATGAERTLACSFWLHSVRRTIAITPTLDELVSDSGRAITAQLLPPRQTTAKGAPARFMVVATIGADTEPGVYRSVVRVPETARALNLTLQVRHGF